MKDAAKRTVPVSAKVTPRLRLKLGKKALKIDSTPSTVLNDLAEAWVDDKHLCPLCNEAHESRCENQVAGAK